MLGWIKGKLRIGSDKEPIVKYVYSSGMELSHMTRGECMELLNAINDKNSAFRVIVDITLDLASSEIMQIIMNCENSPTAEDIQDIKIYSELPREFGRLVDRVKGELVQIIDRYEGTKSEGLDD